MKGAAITIDVDSLRFYRKIHGLPPAHESEDPIYTLAVPRFFQLIGELDVPATLFLVGQDAPAYAAQFAAARELGAEIGNHSFSHDYQLANLPPDAIRKDLERAHCALLPLTPDNKISGFRAPGYNTSPALLAAVANLEYTYDSSRLPSPLYFAARAAAIGAYRLLGRPSQSLIGEWNAFSGSLAPHRQGPLLELPMSCEPLSRIPLIGTLVTAMPARLRHFLVSRTVRALKYFNFEMHAIDLLDSSEVTPDLVGVQRDLKIPVAEKMRCFRQVFSQLKQECTLMTLRDIALAEAQ